MATQNTAMVNITNNTDGTAIIQLYHKNSTNGIQSGSWLVAPGQKGGPLTVNFETGFGALTVLDYWWVSISVADGTTPGKYVSGGSFLEPGWKECELKNQDADKVLNFSVDSKQFSLSIDSGACTNQMNHIGPHTQVNNVFVLMLENHSFDNLFAMSGIPNITVANCSDFNTFNQIPYYVKGDAPTKMPSDPGHEFLDTFQQLCGKDALVPLWLKGSDYPPIGFTVENLGFVGNYATTSSEGNPPPETDIGDIMKCFDTKKQLPVIYQLATEFAICDHWFSSIPGPTWPNRFFVHGASSNGFEHSPVKEELVEWETAHGFKYNNGSIYEALTKAKLNWRIYADVFDAFSDDPHKGSLFGGIPQVGALHGITLFENVNSFSHFAADLQKPYPYDYTFIEPNYGNIFGQYEGGSSQHPMDDVYGGEKLIKATYEAIRNSPVWESSLLIIIYDEHGGFYDSVKPSKAIPPGDGEDEKLNWSGFKFDHYGVRVPAVIVSPLIEKGKIDDTVYDHSSVPATLERIFNFPNLTQRDLHANDLRRLLTLNWPRTDCPTVLNNPAPPSDKAFSGRKTTTIAADLENELLPESGNMIGFMNILLKTELELSSETAEEKQVILENFRKVKTKSEAKAYLNNVLAKIELAKAALNN